MTTWTYEHPTLRRAWLFGEIRLETGRLVRTWVEIAWQVRQDPIADMVAQQHLKRKLLELVLERLHGAYEVTCDRRR